jgi:hypothetical protein
MYVIFVVLHILSAGIWIGLGVVTVLVNNFRKRAAGTLGELYLMRSTLIYGSVMGNIGGIGILITGPAIAGIHHLPWFAFNTVPWLAIKQVIFIVVLAITFAIYVPLSKKIGRKLGEEMGGANPAGGASMDLRTMFDRIVTIGMVVQILVLTNIILGEWQPMLWATMP